MYTVNLNLQQLRTLIWFYNYKCEDSNITLDKLGCRKCKQVEKIYDGETCNNCEDIYCNNCEKVREMNWYCKNCK